MDGPYTPWVVAGFVLLTAGTALWRFYQPPARGTVATAVPNQDGTQAEAPALPAELNVSGAVAPSLWIEEQLVEFRRGLDGSTWAATLLLEGQPTDIRVDIAPAQATRVDWPALEATLRTVRTKYPALLAKAHKNILYLMTESGLFSDWMVDAARPVLLSINLLHPFSPLPAFQLVFELDPDLWIDRDGEWRVSFIEEHVTGVERVLA